MAKYSQRPKSAYAGVPRNDSWNENKDLDWGSYKWPQGVPANLLGQARCSDGTIVVVRKELAELFQVLISWTEAKGYALGSSDGGGWSGGYGNRPIGGTQTASGHSRGRSADFRAQDNGMSSKWYSTWPPEIIAVWVQSGFYWGGHYSGTTDPMHVTFNWYKRDVPKYLEIARRLTGGKVPAVPAPQPQPSSPAPSPNPTPGTVLQIGAFPLPSGYYYGPLDGPKHSISGKHSSDKQSYRDGLARWQSAYNHLAGAYGWAKITVDGLFGDQSRGAAARFQAGAGLPIDGLIGINTWERMKK